jgi:hypothetical protein
MVDFLTLVGVVVAIVVPIVLSIVALIIVVWQEFNKQTNKYAQTITKLDELNTFLRTITIAQIHEKIAVLYDYPTQMPWKPEDVDYKISRISSDVRYLQEVKSILTHQQQEELHLIQNRIVASMQNNNYDTARINSVFQVVFS